MRTSPSIGARLVRVFDRWTSVLRSISPLALLLSFGCSDHRQPPSLHVYAGLPISGSLSDAKRAGFQSCFSDGSSMRCRRDSVMFLKHGPFDAAVDLAGGDGRGGFDQLTLWHDTDQDAVMSITEDLMTQGWRECISGNGRWGGQATYTHKGSPIFLALDLSYWSKRRLRVLPVPRQGVPRC